MRVIDSRDGHPIQGAIVVVNDSSGELIATHQTSTNGTLRLEVPENGTITAAWMSYYQADDQVSQPQRSLTSAYQVKPGSIVELPVFDQSHPPAKPLTMSVTVTLQTDRAITDPGREILFPCSGYFTGEKTITSDKVSPCAGDSSFDIWGFLFDANGDLFSFVSDVGVPFSAGGTLTRTLNANHTTFSATDLNVMAIPPGSYDLRFSVAAYLNTKTSGPLILPSTVVEPSADETLRVRYPGGVYFDRYRTSGRLVLDENYDFEVGFERVEKELAPERDWPVNALARFEASPRVGGATLDQLTVGWSLTSDGRLGDDIYLSTDWEGARWTAFAPPARTGAITLPELPDELAAFLPAADDTPAAHLRHEDFAEVSEYSAFLKHPSSFDGDLDYAAAR